jgi:hypothetical protein
MADLAATARSNVSYREKEAASIGGPLTRQRPRRKGRLTLSPDRTCNSGDENVRGG